MHPWELHPAVVHFPLAFLLAAATLDAGRAGRDDRRPSVAAAGLLLSGVITGLVSAGLGLLAYLTVPAHTGQAHVRKSSLAESAGNPFSSGRIVLKWFHEPVT